MIKYTLFLVLFVFLAMAILGIVTIRDAIKTGKIIHFGHITADRRKNPKGFKLILTMFWIILSLVILFLFALAISMIYWYSSL